MGCRARSGSGGKKTGRNRTDRSKAGTKRSLLVEDDGEPLGVVIAGANLNDHLLLEAAVEAVVVERTEPRDVDEQHLCLDAGHDNQAACDVVERHGYIGHIGPAGEGPGSKRRPGRRKDRRRVVERALAWLSRCRALSIHYDKHDVDYPGLIQLACGLLRHRRLYRINAM